MITSHSTPIIIKRNKQKHKMDALLLRSSNKKLNESAFYKLNELRFENNELKSEIKWLELKLNQKDKIIQNLLNKQNIYKVILQI